MQRDLPQLEVHLSRSVLVDTAGHSIEFTEGPPSAAARMRLERIRVEFSSGFLPQLITECRSPDFALPPISEEAMQLLKELVSAVTGDSGRAIVGLTVLQLSIKAVAPTQSIRLHKGGGSGDLFSWTEGVPMRVLDKQFNTPALRGSGLLSLNADGCFMTRSLAENYPYSMIYKAAIKGAREEWLLLVDLLESGQVDAKSALQWLLTLLIQRSRSFEVDIEQALRHMAVQASNVVSVHHAAMSLLGFVAASTHAARLFEISMHSLCQVVQEQGGYDGVLKPLSQMRSANKKHGNIGDVEILVREGSLQIRCSWDAKYGKSYLRDELDELDEKLETHPETEVAGFVTDQAPDMRHEILERIDAIKSDRRVRVYVLSFLEWVRMETSSIAVDERTIGEQWLRAFAECLCLRRRDVAPIDEPTLAWVSALQVFRLVD